MVKNLWIDNEERIQEYVAELDLPQQTLYQKLVKLERSALHRFRQFNRESPVPAPPQRLWNIVWVSRDLKRRCQW
jgi:hypothetical protein